MIRLIALLLFVSLNLIVSAQSCIPEYIHFYLQSQVDSFAINYPDCTQIEGDVWIDGDSISSLIGLNVLSKIGGDITISYTNLKNLAGLNLLDTIGGVLHIQHNYSLSTLQDFENLKYVGGHFIIAHCHALSDFDGLENLTSIGEALFITFNSGLSNIEGLIGLNSINGGFWIDANNSLTNLEGLNNVDALSINDVFIRSNSMLSKCDVKSICDYLANPTGLVGIHDNSIGCSNENQILDSCTTVGIFGIINESPFLVYPNPTSNYFSISTNNNRDIDEIIVYNMLGKIVLYRKEIHDKINISPLNKGVYILELFIDKQRTQTKLIIK